jgi:hypothetical protein
MFKELKEDILKIIHEQNENMNKEKNFKKKSQNSGSKKIQ